VSIFKAVNASVASTSNYTVLCHEASLLHEGRLVGNQGPWNQYRWIPSHCWKWEWKPRFTIPLLMTWCHQISDWHLYFHRFFRGDWFI